MQTCLLLLISILRGVCVLGLSGSRDRHGGLHPPPRGSRLPRGVGNTDPPPLVPILFSQDITRTLCRICWSKNIIITIFICIAPFALSIIRLPLQRRRTHKRGPRIITARNIKAKSANKVGSDD